MADYRKMYLTLFSAVDELLDRLDDTQNDLVVKAEITEALCRAQQMCEDIYVETDTERE